MMRSRLDPMKALARQPRRHWDDVLAYFGHRCANVILEGLNSIIQNVKNPRKGLQEHELLQRDDLPAANSIYEPSLPDRLHPHQTAKGHRADRTKFLDDFLAILKEYRASLPQPIFSKLVSSQAVRKIQEARKFSDGND